MKEEEGSPGEVTVTDGKGEEVMTAKGYVLTRSQEEVFGENGEERGGYLEINKSPPQLTE